MRWWATAPAIKVNSVVGAGDSPLAGVLIALGEGKGKAWDEALSLGSLVVRRPLPR